MQRAAVPVPTPTAPPEPSPVLFVVYLLELGQPIPGTRLSRYRAKLQAFPDEPPFELIAISTLQGPECVVDPDFAPDEFAQVCEYLESIGRHSIARFARRWVRR